MKVYFLVALFFMTSCATALKQEDLTHVFVVETDLKAQEGYDAMVSYFAKNLNNSNEAVQLKDRAKNKIISKIGIECNAVKNGMLDVNNYTTYFTVEAAFKKNKARFEIVGNSYTSSDFMGKLSSVDTPFGSHQKDGVKECAGKLKDELLDALNSGTSDSDW